MFKTLTRTLLGATFLLLCSQASVNAQCGNTTLDITTSVSQGDRCGSNTEDFSISNPPQYNEIRWNWGDGNTTIGVNTSESFNYQNPGTYTPSVEFLDANGDVICEVETSQDITIFDNPEADFDVSSDKVQCYPSNEFDFQDASTEGDDGAAINDWVWTMGDGTEYNVQNPTHTYANGGEYDITLTVTDANGCTNITVQEEDIQVTSEIEPGYSFQYQTSTGDPDCPETEVEFRNETPDQGRIQDYTFYPGDGSGPQSLPIPWNTFTHTYDDDGSFGAKLIVTDTSGSGCVDTFVDTVRNINFSFDENIIIGDSIACNGDASFNFSHTPRPQAQGNPYVTWNFNHMATPPEPEQVNQWNLSHDYPEMGIFNVDLLINESRECQKDTTYENVVGIEGPVANINHPDVGNPPSPENTYIGPEDQPITRDSFKSINRSDCGVQEVEYVATPDPSASPQTWQRGDPIPGDTVYAPGSGDFNYQNVHDTDLYHRSCKAPNLVRFTNNSVKFRLERDQNGNVKDSMHTVTYDDDETPGLTPSASMPNPGPQWGSDSLDYFWRFQDPSAESCTTQYDWQSKKNDGLYEQTFNKIRFGPDDTVFIDSARGAYDSVHAGHVFVYDETGDSVVFEQGTDFEAFVDTGADDSASADQLFLEWNTALPGAPGGDSLMVEYFMIDTSGSSAKCNFSTATVPYHLFDTTRCFPVQLQAADPVTACTSSATIQIFTTPPDAGWEESFYESQRNLTYNGYNGEDSVAFDSLLHWTDSVNDVPPEALLATRVMKDKDITVFNNMGLPISPSDYEVVNWDLAWLKFTGSKPPNGELNIQYTAKRPQIFPEGDTVTIDTMSYSIQNRLNATYGPNAGPRRGIRLQGPKCEGATQQIQNLEGTFPASQCGSYGKDFGFLPDTGEFGGESMSQTIQCTDSVDTDNDGVYDATVTRDKEIFNWVSGSQTVSNPMAWNWEFEYEEPGCKTLGLWIQTGDCVDTFFYDNYKYIADNDPAHDLLKYENKEVYTDEEIQSGFCIGEIGVDSFPFYGMPQLTDQQDIINYQFAISSMDEYISEESYQFELGTDSIVDTVFRFCTGGTGVNDDGVKVCSASLMNYPERTCGKSVTDELSFQDMMDSDDYEVFDTMYVINLEDTAELAIHEPGVYNRVSQITNAQGCANQTEVQEPMYVGHYSNYESYVPDQNNDSTVCIGDTVYFKNPDVGRGNHFYYLDHHLPTYFEMHEVDLGNRTEVRFLHEERKFQNPKGREAPFGGTQYEEVEYDLNSDSTYETKYDIDLRLFVQDRDDDGTYEDTLAPRDVDNDGAVDTVPYYVYTESGTYDISLKSTDSTGCAQIRRQEEKIVVTDVEAFIGLGEEPGVCAPQTVRFRDSSKVFNAYRYTYDDAGNVKDSTKVDSIGQYHWSFDDHRDETPTLDTPTYVFTRNGEFTPTLIATTATGCSDTTSQMIRRFDTADQIDTNSVISLLGPKPGFVINNPKGCEPHTVEFKDTSERVSNWTFFKGVGGEDNQAAFTNLPSDSIFRVEYDSAGVYYAKLLAEETVPNTATDSVGDSVSCQIYFPDTSDLGGKPLQEYEGVRVNVKETNEASFTVDNAPLCPGEPLLITNQSDTLYDSFYFAMGNGDTVTTHTSIDSAVIEDGDTTIFSVDTTVLVREGESVFASDTSFEADGDFDFDFQAGDTLIRDDYDESRTLTSFPYDYGVNADSSFTITLLPMGNDTLCYDTFERTIETGGIEADLDTLPARIPIFRFTNLSEYGEEFEWFFPDGTIQDSVTADNWDEIVSSDPGRRAADLSEETRSGGNYNNGVLETSNPDLEPELDYRSDQGDYDVCILARRGDYGCAEVACMTINNPFDTSFKRANVLTPNGDGENDRLQFELEGAVDFELRVYNRWGDLVYETKQGQSNYRCEESGGQTRRCKFWNGRKNNTGNDSPAGTYYYTFEYQLRDGETQQKTGVVTLIR